MQKQKKIAIFIPTYNAGSTVPLVIDRIPNDIKKEVKEIFVIDNASPDNTYLTIIGYKAKKKMSNLKIIRNERNLGYGGSQKKAFRYAIKKGYDIIVMLHGDAQYAPEKIPLILEPLEEEKADMVFGSRMSGAPLKGGMPLWRFFGNRVLTMLENLILGLNLSEYHSGFRAFSCDALKQIPFNLCTNDYNIDTDILIQFKLKGLRIAERPIPTHYGEESKSPTVNQTFLYSYNILKSLYYYYLHVRGIRRVAKFDIK